MANSNLVTREDLKNVFEALGASLENVDYIVEEGTSGNWTYRKWNSGIVEFWGRQDLTVPSGWSSDGALPITFPFTVKAINGWNVTEMSYRVDRIYLNGMTTTNCQANTHSAAAGTFGFNFQFWGRWK